MNWDAIGAIGEIVGAIVVVITLVFLVRQLRQHTEGLRVESLSSTYGEWNAMTGELQVQPELRSAYLKDAKGESLTTDEFLVLTVYFIRMLHTNDKAHHLYRQGSVDEFNYINMQKTLISVLRQSTIFQDWWKSQKWRFSESFQDLLDVELNNDSGT